MEIKGTMYKCDGKGCSESIFLEDGEDIADMDWLQINGEGLFCEECAGDVAARVKAECKAENDAENFDRMREERMLERWEEKQEAERIGNEHFIGGR